MKRKGTWIPLEELLTYTEIGSAKSRSRISYPEAGAFVKFLVETYGKDKFLQAYKQLKNSSKKSEHKRNKAKLERIYGRPLEQLAKQFQKAYMAERPAVSQR